jgi:hypothetical protein
VLSVLERHPCEIAISPASYALGSVDVSRKPHRAAAESDTVPSSRSATLMQALRYRAGSLVITVTRPVKLGSVRGCCSEAGRGSAEWTIVECACSSFDDACRAATRRFLPNSSSAPWDPAFKCTFMHAPRPRRPQELLLYKALATVDYERCQQREADSGRLGRFNLMSRQPHPQTI